MTQERTAPNSSIQPWSCHGQLGAGAFLNPLPSLQVLLVLVSRSRLGKTLDLPSRRDGASAWL